MTSVAHPSSTPPSSSPPSVTNSEASSTHLNNPLPPCPLTPPQQQQPHKEPPRHQDEAGTGNVGSDDLEETKPNSMECLDNIGSEEELKKYQKYEADFSQRLMAKYFSNQNIYGGDTFDLNIMVGAETVRASRWPSTRSYADPVRSFTQGPDSGSTRAPYV